ncbi:NAD(P)H-dependent FMN reductase [Syntrophus gentianae]|uniref:NAD(P)H-dependent FMN reductase n=1 Tax=Syntrophus gentianae TaxID=43775 RepID=A0A1H7UYI5_9BACT|nr:NAD(P)H-dependent oxidoreductase [Syntrophus gentianae]SEM01705.1 NAD(P)H-dependent FMN reductase [Syntrophus gentianae]
MTKKIAVFVGSLRKESFNRKMAGALMELAPKSLTFEMIEIGQLPLYNQDYDDEGTPPAEYSEFRQSVKPFDGVLFVTPEYNRSVPAVLKNALDVGSRPFGQSVWGGKPGAVVSVSPGAIGGFGANHHLRQSLVFLDIPIMAQPEAYIGGAAQLFDGEGKIANEGTRGFLVKFMETFAAWVEKNTAKNA